MMSSVSVLVAARGSAFRVSCRGIGSANGNRTRLHLLKSLKIQEYKGRSTHYFAPRCEHGVSIFGLKGC